MRKRKSNFSDPVDGSSLKKKCKLADSSQLPVDYLREIFNYLNMNNNSMKALTETCTLFEDICSRRLYLDIKRIHPGETFLKITLEAA